MARPRTNPYVKYARAAAKTATKIATSAYKTVAGMNKSKAVKTAGQLYAGYKAARSLGEGARRAYRYWTGKKRVRNVTRSTGFQGHVKPGPKKIKTDEFLKKGSVIKTEFGGSVSASDLTHSVYAGYGTPMKTVSKAVIRAIVKKLVEKAGFHIRDYSRPACYDLVAGANLPNKKTVLRFRIQWRYGGVTTTPSIVSLANTSFEMYTALGAPNTTNTWIEICNLLDGAIATDVNEGTMNSSGGNSLHFDNIAMSIYNETEDHEIPLSNFNGEDIHLYFRVNSGMKVSNVTKAATSDGDEYSEDNILANPLTGKLYTIKKWKNGFVQKNQAYNDASGVVLVAEADDPVFTTSSNVTNSALLKKPPKHYFFVDCAYSQSVNLEPGAIKQFGTGFTCKMSWNTFINKYKEFIGYSSAQFSNTSQAPFGHTQMIGLECMLNNRSESGAVVSIDYELNQTVGVYASINRSSTQPIINIV